MAAAHGSDPCARKGVRVQLPPCAPWKTNPAGTGGWLLTSTRLRPWGSCPLSSAREDEPVRHWVRLESERVPRGTGIRVLRPPLWKMKLAGASHRPESGWVRKDWDSSSPSSALESVPPAAAASFEHSHTAQAVGDRHLRFPLGTIHLVDEAILIRWLRRVQLPGAQLAGSQDGEGACLISRRRAGSSPARPTKAGMQFPLMDLATPGGLYQAPLA